MTMTNMKIKIFSAKKDKISPEIEKSRKHQMNNRRRVEKRERVCV